LLDIVS
jgi:hypothetical protein